MASRPLACRRSACLPLFAMLALCAAGCATTDRWLVDPSASSGLYVVSVTQEGSDHRTNFIDFDAAGGHLDPGMLQVRGRTEEGDSVAVALAEVRAFRFRYAAVDTGRLWDARLDPLLDAGTWAPRDRVQTVVRTNGRILRTWDVPVTVDTGSRVIRFPDDAGTETVVPFGEIACLQTHNTHAGRSIPLAIFFSLIVAAGIGINAAFGQGFIQ